VYSVKEQVFDNCRLCLENGHTNWFEQPGSSEIMKNKIKSLWRSVVTTKDFNNYFLYKDLKQKLNFFLDRIYS